MKLFSELSTFEKAGLTSEEIDKYVEVELMVRGVALPEKPNLEVIPVAPEFDKKALWFVVARADYGCCCEIGFDSPEDAQALMAQLQRPCFTEGQVYVSSGKSPEYHKRVNEVHVEVRHLYSQSDAEILSKYVRSSAEAEDRNKAALKAHSESMVEADEIRSEIMGEVRAARATGHRYREILATYSKYKDLAGDDETAMRFLLNQFSLEDVTLAQEWDLLEHGEVAERGG